MRGSPRTFTGLHSAQAGRLCRPGDGQRDRASYVLQQGKIRLVLTTPLHPEGDDCGACLKHGDGVKVWRCGWTMRAVRGGDDQRGAKSVREPFEQKDEHGTVVMASIATYGETIHTFVERKNYKGPFLPGFRATPEDTQARPVGLLHIDHMVGNVGWNEMNTFVELLSRRDGLRALSAFR